MKILMHLIQTITVVLFFAMMMSGCRKFVDVDEPIDKITTENVFGNEQSANAAVTGVYSQMMVVFPYFFSGGITINAGLSADELNYTGTGTDLLAFNNNSISANNSTILNDLWGKAYGIIYHINASLEGLEKSTAVKDSVKKQLKGELLFLRSYSYFYLVNLFGDVPLITVTDASSNAVLGRTGVSVVYQKITDDLELASTLMSTNYAMSGRVRANRWAAKAMLARVYLYLQQWTKAEQAASDVIGSGSYTMVGLNNVFLATSNEAIWQLAPTSTIMNTVEGNRFIPAASLVKPTYALTPMLVNSFEVNDQRKVNWVKSNTVSSVVYWYPYKYKVRTASTVTENYMMLRLAEQYLIRAEARVQQDKIPEAKTDINVIRIRAGLAATTATDKNSLLNAVEQERRVEFFAEWGHRWLDLKRWAKADAVLSYKTGWQSTDVLYPIPQSELLQNVALTQNAGY